MNPNLQNNFRKQVESSKKFIRELILLEISQTPEKTIRYKFDTCLCDATEQACLEIAEEYEFNDLLLRMKADMLLDESQLEDRLNQLDLLLRNKRK